MFVFKIDGKDYPLESLNAFTGRELSSIKQLSGCRAREIPEALSAGDTDLYVALLCIAMRRAGKTPDVDAILDRDLGDLTVTAVGEDEDDEDAAGPLDAESSDAPVTE